MTVRRTQSEVMAQSVAEQVEADGEKDKLQGCELDSIFEADSIRELCDYPEVVSVKRLSCFEEICPSEFDEEIEQDI